MKEFVFSNEVDSNINSREFVELSGSNLPPYRFCSYKTLEDLEAERQRAGERNQGELMSLRSKLDVLHERSKLSEELASAAEKAGLTTLNLSESFLPDPAKVRSLEFWIKERELQDYWYQKKKNETLESRGFIDMSDITPEQEQQVVQGHGLDTMTKLGYRKFWKLLRSLRYSSIMESVIHQIEKDYDLPRLDNINTESKEQITVLIREYNRPIVSEINDESVLRKRCVENHELNPTQIANDQTKFNLVWSTPEMESHAVGRFYISPPYWLQVDLYERIAVKIDELVKSDNSKTEYGITLTLHRSYDDIRADDGIIVYVDLPNSVPEDSDEAMQKWEFGQNIAAHAVREAVEELKTSASAFDFLPEEYRTIVERSYRYDSRLSRISEAMIPLDTEIDVAYVEHNSPNLSYRQNVLPDNILNKRRALREVQMDRQHEKQFGGKLVKVEHLKNAVEEQRNIEDSLARGIYQKEQMPALGVTWSSDIVM
jgi:hypothetical protein